MSKTYSVAICNSNGIWFTNWGEYFKLKDIDFEKVKSHCEERGCIAYGYYYGTHSRNLVSKKCRTVLWEKEEKTTK